MKQTTLPALVAATMLSQGCVSPLSFPVNIDGVRGEYRINSQGNEKVCGLVLYDREFIIDGTCDNHLDAMVTLPLNPYTRFSYTRREFNDQQIAHYDSLLERAQRMTAYNK